MRNRCWNWFYSTFWFLFLLTVQSATSSLSGFQLAAFVFPIDVDSCCRMTVNKSERERFISDFGLSFSLDPEILHSFISSPIYISIVFKKGETNLWHLTCVRGILHCVKSMRTQFDRSLDPDFYPRIDFWVRAVKVLYRNWSIVRICSKCSEWERHMLR